MRNFMVVCRTSPSWDLSDVFLMLVLVLWDSGKKITKVKCHFHHITARIYTINMIWYWPWSPGWGSVRVLQCKATLPPTFLRCILLELAVREKAHCGTVSSLTAVCLPFAATGDMRLLPWKQNHGLLFQKTSQSNLCGAALCVCTHKCVWSVLVTEQGWEEGRENLHRTPNFPWIPGS